MSSQKERTIITDLMPDSLIALQATLQHHILIVKFGATWCAPCQRIKAQVNQCFVEMPRNVLCADIDIDESIDLYVGLKSKKMVKGVPTILAFYGDTARDKWYIPDDSVSGGDAGAVASFFQRCAAKAQSLL